MKEKLKLAYKNWHQPKLTASVYKKTIINSLAIIICAYFVADFVSLATTPLIPEINTPKMPLKALPKKNLTQYNEILSRNLFNEKGLIPETDEFNNGFDGPPVKSSLPLNLLGVIVVQDELKSIASVEDKGANQVLAVRVNELITPEALVQKIESNKVIFYNKNSGKKEFIAFAENIIAPSVRPKSSAGTGIQKASETNYQIERAEVDKTLANLNEVLTQARCVPNFENGRASGYRCFQIVPNSIYDKLGMKDGDVICGINGQTINDPGKAFEIFGQLRTMSSVELCLKRGNQVMNMHYDLR